MRALCFDTCRNRLDQCAGLLSGTVIKNRGGQLWGCAPAEAYVDVWRRRFGPDVDCGVRPARAGGPHTSGQPDTVATRRGGGRDATRERAHRGRGRAARACGSAVRERASGSSSINTPRCIASPRLLPITPPSAVSFGTQPDGRALSTLMMTCVSATLGGHNDVVRPHVAFAASASRAGTRPMLPVEVGRTTRPPPRQAEASPTEGTSGQEGPTGQAGRARRAAQAGWRRRSAGTKGRRAGGGLLRAACHKASIVWQRTRNSRRAHWLLPHASPSLCTVWQCRTPAGHPSAEDGPDPCR